MNQKFTLEKIAELAGVSRSTVSRVVNNHISVSPEVRERVLNVVQETGYHPDPAARSLAGQRSRIIGLVIAETAEILFTDPYFPRLIQGITQACNAHDYTLSLFLFHTTEDEGKLSHKIVRNQVFDGIIATSTRVGDLLIPQLLDNQVPFVLIGRHDDPRISFLDADNVAGGYLATSHLIRTGYKRIATITGPMNNSAAIDRLQGYRNAFQDRGLPIHNNLIAIGAYTELSGYEAMESLLPQRPDAVFVASDAMAIGALRALRAANLSVPHDVAIVGYDDLPPASHTDPPLTTVRQPIKRVGAMAVETLLDILDNGLEPPRRMIMPTELVVRASCRTYAKKEELSFTTTH